MGLLAVIGPSRNDQRGPSAVCARSLSKTLFSSQKRSISRSIAGKSGTLGTGRYMSFHHNCRDLADVNPCPTMRPMDHREVGRYWEGNAAAWTALSRQGWDVYRDAVNTPAFLAMLPDVAGLRGLDVGCGEGHNTRLLAERGARMTAIDIAPTFVRFARESEVRQPLGIRYLAASGQELPFAPGVFDFVTAWMSLMDMPGHHLALRECYRVLRGGGFLQFSILHPCFSPPHRRLLRNPQREAYAVEVGRYFDRVDGRIDR